MNSNFDPYEVINRTNEIERAQMIKEKNDCENTIFWVFSGAFNLK